MAAVDQVFLSRFYNLFGHKILLKYSQRKQNIADYVFSANLVLLSRLTLGHDIDIDNKMVILMMMMTMV